MSFPKIVSIDLNNPAIVSVQIWFDETMLINQTIDRPAGDPETWTIGQLKKLAIDAARSKIPAN